MDPLWKLKIDSDSDKEAEGTNTNYHSPSEEESPLATPQVSPRSKQRRLPLPKSLLSPRKTEIINITKETFLFKSNKHSKNDKFSISGEKLVLSSLFSLPSRSLGDVATVHVVTSKRIDIAFEDGEIWWVVTKKEYKDALIQLLHKKVPYPLKTGWIEDKTDKVLRDKFYCKLFEKNVLLFNHERSRIVHNIPIDKIRSLTKKEKGISFVVSRKTRMWKTDPSWFNIIRDLVNDTIPTPSIVISSIGALNTKNRSLYFSTKQQFSFTQTQTMDQNLSSYLEGSLSDSSIATPRKSLGGADALLHPHRDWTAEFQSRVNDLRGVWSNNKEYHKRHILKMHFEMDLLYNDFVKVATYYTIIIVNEITLGDEFKSIRAVEGGLLGGVKYQIGGLFLKMGSRQTDLYSNKVISLDFLGLTNYFDCEIEGLHYPMACIVNYLGFRVLCMTSLGELSSRTLVYGTPNAGKFFARDNPLILSKLKEAADKLNLATIVSNQVQVTKAEEVKVLHSSMRSSVLNTSRDSDNLESDDLDPSLKNEPTEPKEEPIKTTLQTTLHSASDLEGHLIHGNFFLIDFSRFMPPFPPKQHPGYQLVTCLMRPELVLKSQSRLCPDTFCPFVDFPEKHEHCMYIQDMCTTLEETIIPKFAKKLITQDTSIDLIYELHRKGINVRYLGRIYNCIKDNDSERASRWKERIILEMFSRTIKTKSQKILKDSVIRRNGESYSKQKLMKYFRNIFTPYKPRSWISLIDMVNNKFSTTFKGDINEPQELHHILFWEKELLKKVSPLLGIEWQDYFYDRIDTGALKTETIFHPISIKSIQPTVKLMNISYICKAYLLKPFISPESNCKARLRAVEYLMTCLRTSPRNKYALHMLAQIDLFNEMVGSTQRKVFTQRSSKLGTPMNPNI